MYTQCAKCETVFRLSADVLRAAGGQVRCGKCGEVFNALARLAEDASAFPTGESALEMEARADQILESTVPPLGHGAAAAEEDADEMKAADVEFARLRLLDKFDDEALKEAPAKTPEAARDDRADDAAKAAEAARTAAALKVAAAAARAAALKAAMAKPATPAGAARPPPAPQSSPPAAPPSPSAAPPKAQSGAQPAGSARPAAGAKPAGAAKGADERKAEATPTTTQPSAEESLEFTLPPGELDRIFIEAAPRSASAVPTAAGATEGAEPQPAERARARIAGLEVPDEVRREMLEGIDERALFTQIEMPARRPLPFALWLGAALVLALLLAGQMIHENRDWLGAHAPLRGPLHGLYALLGVAPAGSPNLSAYQLRQWGVTGDPSAAGTLRVRASILNTTAQLQPYPLLRVTLANRFGARIGTRDFEPAEYLGKPVLRMLAPGERADATLDIVDPGKDAEGFEIDVCLRSGAQKIACAGDAASQTPAAP